MQHALSKIALVHVAAHLPVINLRTKKLKAEIDFLRSITPKASFLHLYNGAVPAMTSQSCYRE